MIIWINGAFGAGKTQTAHALHRRIPDSYVFDPECAGYYIRDNLPATVKKGDFQNYPMWRCFNYQMLRYLSDTFAGTILVPMTITDGAYYDEIIGNLRQDGVDVRHFVLSATEQTLYKRLHKRLETKNGWPAQQIPRCIKAFQTVITEGMIDTNDKSIEEVVSEIAKRCGLELAPDKRGRVRKAFDQIRSQIKYR